MQKTRRGFACHRWWLGFTIQIVIAAWGEGLPPAWADEEDAAPPADIETMAENAEASASQAKPAVESDAELDDLSALSLEELMAIKVTSVAGVEQEWFRTPASMYVLTNEDVRRSGHQTLADALRMVPGMHVAQFVSHQWRVESRGWTGVTVRSNKNLVLIDGRSVWDPLYSGVWWDAQDILLEDLDRIEVVRGPGATLWGANAVNGVINVVTKSAEDTQGLYVTGLAGNYIQGLTAARYGGKINDDTFYRVWGKYRNFDNFDVRKPFDETFGEEWNDDWSTGEMGFRIDGHGDDGVTYTIESSGYASFTYGHRLTLPVPNATLQNETVITDGRISCAHILGRIVNEYAPDAGWSLQTYYDRTERLAPGGGFQVDRDTLDAEFRHWFQWGERQSLIWGSRVNFTTDDTTDGPQLSFDPASQDHYTLNAFAQNTSELIDDKLFAMIGSKFEYNDFTGFEIQPSARVWLTPDANNMIWAGISRAVRVPSRLELEGLITVAYADEGLLSGGPPTGTFAHIGFVGDDDLDSEELLAYEAGYRTHLTPQITLDNTLFYHEYDELIYQRVPDASLLDPFTNLGYGESYGLESSVSWQVAPTWRLEAGYGYVNVHQRGPTPQFEDINTPHHQAQLRSYLDVTKNLELNAALYYVDNLPSAAEVSRVRMDVGVTWFVNKNMEIAVWGQNLLDPGHSEAAILEVPRTFYLQVTLRF